MFTAGQNAAGTKTAYTATRGTGLKLPAGVGALSLTQ